MSEGSAQHLRDGYANVGALVLGRRLFDLTNGWHGRHPMGVPAVVVTRAAPQDRAFTDDAPFTFRHRRRRGRDQLGVGDRGGGALGRRSRHHDRRQCLDLGLLDEIRVAFAPVLLGRSVPWFANLHKSPVRLSDPRVIAGIEVTHPARQGRSLITLLFRGPGPQGRLLITLAFRGAGTSRSLADYLAVLWCRGLRAAR
ncbi:dihydrofolate reductase family protein [Dactylosporangium sp. CA-233914]|uniref:dihydrofolate reductase family protein n=1 Tax=Dactylosporangium sp. CA-233914 TaxID=3239934 RepID=UPI003D8FF566